MPGLPTGTVTMVFTDIEGSTALLSRLGDRYAAALQGQRDLLRAAWAGWGGAEMGTEGDSFFVVFDVAVNAANAALQAQRDLASYPWPANERVAVRMGLHTGEPARHEDGYVGMDVHRAARVAATAHGGQVVMSKATAALVSGHLGDEVDLVDLGRHRLKDIAELEHLFQLCVPDLPSEFPPLKSLGTATNLPLPTTPLLGRRRELSELVALIASPDVRLVTLTGPGGSGKTRLATAVAAELAASYPEGAYFVPLAAVTSADAMWTTVAEALGAPGEQRARLRFLEWVRTRYALLVLDNLEQLSGAADVVCELVEAAPELHVLSTSRRPLHLQGEHEYPVPPLGLPDAGGVDAARRSEAVQLFCLHAARVRRNFALTADNESAVAALCERLDGLPLAIELAAARVKLLSPSALLARLEHTTDLTTRDVDRPERQQTLRAAIDWSYQLLPADLQACFRRLGVFAGGGDLDAVAAVAAPGVNVLDAVAELHDVSLITVGEASDGEPRIAMLQTIRDFALERLKEAGELEEARRLQADHYVEVARILNDHLEGDRPMTGQDGLDRELDNMRDVLAWALGADHSATREPSLHQVKIGFRVCEYLYPYWVRNGQLAEARLWYERALGLAGDKDSVDLAQHMLWFGAVRFLQGELVESVEPLTNALAMSRRLGHEMLIASALRVLAEVHISTGDFDIARAELQDSLARARSSNDDRRMAIALSDRGWLEYLAENPELATEFLEQSLSHFKALGARTHIPEDMLLLASARLGAGDLVDASRRLDELTKDAVLLGDHQQSCDLVEQHALLAAARSQWQLAGRLVGAAEELRARQDAPNPPALQAYLDRHLAGARDALGSMAWEQARRDGHRLTLEDALGKAAALHSGHEQAEASS